MIRQVSKEVDPLAVSRLLWPKTVFYRKQKETMLSVWRDDETVVVAGNMLGKDYVAGRIIVAFFLTRHPCRIVTTSAKDQHLDVLWGEINQAIQESEYPLDYAKGGNLIINARNIKKVVNGVRCPLSYVQGMVASADSIAAMQGHHIAKTGDMIPRTLFVCDESSSVMDEYYKMARTWSDRRLAFGNPWPCENFFFKAVEGDLQTDTPGGDIPRDSGVGFHRKVIHVRATDSPNVRLGLAQKARGEEPTDEILIPGVKPYSTYVTERKLWDPIQLCVSHEGEFYKGAEVYMFPLDRLEAAMAVAERLEREYGRHRKARTIGVDPGEGGANTVWTAADHLGLIEQRSKKTPDTSVVTDMTLGMMREYGVPAERVFFDRGGGGKEHADYMRRSGYNVQTIAFGEAVNPPKKRGMTPFDTKLLDEEERYAYINRRSEMYGMFGRAIDPGNGPVYGIPRRMVELVRQLRPIPKKYDKEGRMWLPPKNKPPGSTDSKMITMISMLGCSPDEADSAVMSYYGIIRPVRRSVAGAVT